MWQDTALLFIQLGFCVALIPMLIHNDHKPEFLSSLWTSILGLAMTFVFLTLELWAGAISAAVVCAMWFVLTYQRYRINKSADIPLVRLPAWLAWVPPL